MKLLSIWIHHQSNYLPIPRHASTPLRGTLTAVAAAAAALPRRHETVSMYKAFTRSHGRSFVTFHRFRENKNTSPLPVDNVVEIRHESFIPSFRFIAAKYHLFYVYIYLLSTHEAA